MDPNSSTSQGALIRSPSPRTTNPASTAQANGRRAGAILIALALVLGGVSLAVSQHWLSLAALRPLLFALPCALIVLLCFRGARPSSKPDPNTQSNTQPHHPDKRTLAPPAAL